jgi:hypothetical protein
VVSQGEVLARFPVGAIMTRKQLREMFPGSRDDESPWVVRALLKWKQVAPVRVSGSPDQIMRLR